VALCQDGVVVAMHRGGTMQQQAASINTTIADVLAAAGSTLNMVQAIAVCAGPGSYTGLRIGMATAKGLCYALDKKLLLVNKLELLAGQAHALHGCAYAQYVAIIKARDNEYFVSAYDADFSNTVAPQLLLTDQLHDILQELESVCYSTSATEIVPIAQNGSDKMLILPGEIDEKYWAKQAEASYMRNEYDSIFSAAPVYMKNVYFHNKQ
jgi:tRNA threonylcarbamoyladenosine biosynthesis protein TsaB